MLFSFSEYPEELHDLHADYPLAPERMCPTAEQLSPKQVELLGMDISFYKPNQKLIPNLFNKHNYIIHYRNLKLYLSLGLRIMKVCNCNQ